MLEGTDTFLNSLVREMLLKVLLPLLILVVCCSPTKLLRRELTDYPLAVCNDGTPAAYFYSEHDLHADHVLIYLQGGGSCFSAESCAARCASKPELCTSDQEEYKALSHTIWSEDQAENPPFHDFGKVLVDYCSSDLHSGTREPSDETNGYYMHGRHILEAVMDDIIKHKPNVNEMKQLVFLGSSAGAFGVDFNCDFMADKFLAANSGIDVRCIADSGDFYPAWVHVEDCDPYQLDEMAHQFWQSKGDQSCYDSLPPPGLECLIFSSAYPYTQTPFMAVNHYIDSHPDLEGPCTPPHNQNQEFWNTFEPEKYSMALTFLEDRPDNAIFLSNCMFHSAAQNDFAWSEMDVPLVNGEGSELLKNIVRNWLTGEGPYQAMDLPLQKNPKCTYV